MALMQSLGDLLEPIVDWAPNLGNAVHAVRTQRKCLDVGNYSHPSYVLVVKH